MSKIIIPNKKILKHDCVISGIGTPYLYNKGGGVIDDIGRQHVNLYGRCEICNEEILVAIIHVDKNGTIYPQKHKQ